VMRISDLRSKHVSCSQWTPGRWTQTDRRVTMSRSVLRAGPVGLQRGPMGPGAELTSDPGQQPDPGHIHPV